MNKSGVFELGDQVKLVGRDNPYVGRKGIFLRYQRADFFQVARVVVRMEGIREDEVDRDYAFSQGEVELDKKRRI